MYGIGSVQVIHQHILLELGPTLLHQPNQHMVDDVIHEPKTVHLPSSINNIKSQDLKKQSITYLFWGAISHIKVPFTFYNFNIKD